MRLRILVLFSTSHISPMYIRVSVWYHRLYITVYYRTVHPYRKENNNYPYTVERMKWHDVIEKKVPQ